MPEAIACIFCADSTAYIALQENGYCGKKCKKCSLIYISPRPTPDEIIDLYGHSNAQVTAQSHITDSLLKRLHARHTLKILSSYKTDGELLEIGSGGGFFLDEARNKGFVPYGIELNPTQAHFMQHSLKISCETTPLDTQSFGAKQFDVLYHSDVLSHFHDPVKEFRTMHEKMKDGGVMIFETGNIGDINSKFYTLFKSFQYPDHLFFFSEQNIKTLLEQTGFKLIKMYHYNIAPQLWTLKMLDKFLGVSTENQVDMKKTAVKSSYLRPLCRSLYHRLLHVVRYQFGALLPKKQFPQTLICIAKKQ
jgi:2-polyprenyl-3-methyl-5-hydroxy-6-metoxy-1,4-benzoquinol methylase